MIIDKSLQIKVIFIININRASHLRDLNIYVPLNLILFNFIKNSFSTIAADVILIAFLCGFSS